MANLLRTLILSTLGVLLWAETAQAIPINRCAQLVRDQAGREILSNRCNTCITFKVERRRPGQSTLGTPNSRDFNVPAGTYQALPFRGPGKTRIVSESPCPTAQDGN